VPLYGVSNRANQSVGIGAPFDQVVLGTLLERPRREGFIIKTRKNQDGEAKGLIMDLDQATHPRFIRESQVEQDYIKFILGQPAPSLAQSIDMRHAERGRIPFGKRFLHQTRVARIVFHEQNLNRRIGHGNHLAFAISALATAPLPIPALCL
jgi:hypothetical protein